MTKCILVVEDQEDLRAILRDLLSTSGIRRNLNITLPWARVGQARFSYAGLRLTSEESAGRAGVLSGSIGP